MRFRPSARCRRRRTGRSHELDGAPVNVIIGNTRHDAVTEQVAGAKGIGAASGTTSGQQLAEAAAQGGVPDLCGLAGFLLPNRRTRGVYGAVSKSTVDSAQGPASSRSASCSAWSALSLHRSFVAVQSTR